MTTITIDRAVVEQALEALENFARFQRMMMDGPDVSDRLLAEDYAEAGFMKMATAIPALRAALAEPSAEQFKPTPLFAAGESGVFMEQEPVAYFWTNIQSGHLKLHGMRTHLVGRCGIEHRSTPHPSPPNSR